MFVAVVVLYLLCLTRGDLVQYRCSDIAETSMTFTPVTSIPGRYRMELCAVRNPNITTWTVELWYFEGTMCNKTRYKPTPHSLVHESIDNSNKCDNVCYALDLDIIFTGCYSIRSEFKAGRKSLREKVGVFSVKNNLTRALYRNTKPKVINTAHEKDTSLRWILDIPIPNKFSIRIKKKKNNSEEYYDYLVPDRTSCRVSNIYEVLCNLVLPAGCYEAYLRFDDPPWYTMLSEKTESMYQFCRSASLPQVDGSAGARGAWWALGGVLLLAAAALAGARLARVLRGRDFRERVKAAWPAPPAESEAPRVESAAEYNVLLLYARDGEHGQRALAALRALLQHACGAQVLDVYSAQVTALGAPALGAWLRGTLEHPRTKVVLLQSPALLHLYCTKLQEDNMRLEEPLLGRGAFYRAPHIGDNLVLMALRMISESVAAHHHYHKYYLATYESTCGEILPQLVPYRRYVLPRAALTLVRDLGSTNSASSPDSTNSPDTAHLLDHFQSAADEFIAHVHSNPDYLMDELVTL